MARHEAEIRRAYTELVSDTSGSGLGNAVACLHAMKGCGIRRVFLCNMQYFVFRYRIFLSQKFAEEGGNSYLCISGLPSTDRLPHDCKLLSDLLGPSSLVPPRHVYPA